MKRFLTLCLALCSVAAISQDDTYTTVNGRNNEMKTLFNSGSAVGGYLGITTKMTEINGGYGLMTGGQLAVILNHSLGLGVAGYGLVSSVSSNTLHSNGDKLYYQMGYGGLHIEPVILPNEIVHLTIPMLIGAGGVAETTYQPFDVDQYWDEASVEESSAFLVLEPGLNVELNVFKVLRIDLGASYRWVGESVLTTTTDSQLSGFGGHVTFKLGWF